MTSAEFYLLDMPLKHITSQTSDVAARLCIMVHYLMAVSLYVEKYTVLL